MVRIVRDISSRAFRELWIVYGWVCIVLEVVVPIGKPLWDYHAGAIHSGWEAIQSAGWGALYAAGVIFLGYVLCVVWAAFSIIDEERKDRDKYRKEVEDFKTKKLDVQISPIPDAHNVEDVYYVNGTVECLNAPVSDVQIKILEFIGLDPVSTKPKNLELAWSHGRHGTKNLVRGQKETFDIACLVKKAMDDNAHVLTVLGWMGDRPLQGQWLGYGTHPIEIQITGNDIEPIKKTAKIRISKDGSENRIKIILPPDGP